MGLLEYPGVLKKRSMLVKNLEEYASRSSVHGISYVFDKTAFLFDHFIWFLIVFAFGCVAIFMVHQSYTEWQNDQVIMTVKTVAKPVSELEFPAVTICGSGRHMDIVGKILTSNFET